MPKVRAIMFKQCVERYRGELLASKAVQQSGQSCERRIQSSAAGGVTSIVHEHDVSAVEIAKPVQNAVGGGGDAVSGAARPGNHSVARTCERPGHRGGFESHGGPEKEGTGPSDVGDHVVRAADLINPVLCLAEQAGAVVIEGVIRQLMPFVVDSSDQVRRGFGVATDDEKGGEAPSRVQNVQHMLGRTLPRTIVEGQCKLLVMRWAMPDRAAK